MPSLFTNEELDAVRAAALPLLPLLPKFQPGMLMIDIAASLMLARAADFEVESMCRGWRNEVTDLSVPGQPQHWHRIVDRAGHCLAEAMIVGPVFGEVIDGRVPVIHDATVRLHGDA